jgi:hypothetical protein
MINKNISVEEATEVSLKFKDGKIIKLAFNARALSYLNDQKIGGLKGLMSQKSIAEYCAKIIYVTAKSAGNAITIEEAKKITSEMKPITVNEIIAEFQESWGGAVTEEDKKKLLAEMMETMMK